jgi:hypothetical protein
LFARDDAGITPQKGPKLDFGRRFFNLSQKEAGEGGAQNPHSPVRFADKKSIPYLFLRQVPVLFSSHHAGTSHR